MNGYVKVEKGEGGNYTHKDNSVYIKDHFLLIEAEPIEIMDELINGSYIIASTINGSRTITSDSIKYTIKFRTNLSDKDFIISGNSVGDIAEILNDLCLTNPLDTDEVIDYLKTIINLTRLANKEIG